jgi:Ti-type conjugative transfer relaxase TraA
MLSISAMSGGQGAYYTGLAREDYYLEGGEPPGLWEGKGAKMMRMDGQVDKEQFASLFSGFDARGNPLVQNAGGETRQPGWDLTFSAPKSVSVLWSLLPKEMGTQIRDAHMEGVKQACKYLEDEAGWTRRGKAGHIREKTGLVIGLFEHGTSRAGDPQLHTHALVLNIGVRADGTTGSIESKPLYEHKMAAGALYRAELAKQLELRLGLESRRVKTWFEVEGVDPKLIEHWSSRRAEIEAALEKSGFSSARASEMAAVTTRQVKQHVAREELFEQWQQHGEQSGWGTEKAQKLCLSSQRELDPPEVAKALAVRDALTEITSQNSYFAAKDLVRRTAEQAQGRGIGAREALDAAKEFLKDHAVSLGDSRGQPLYTTREMLELERGMLEKVEASRDRQSHQVGLPVREEVFHNHSHLRNEQKEAVNHIVAGQGSIAVVTGMAGTGKTTMLKAAAEMWKQAGFTVKGAALAGKAADGLSNEAGIESSTIARTLFLIEKGEAVFSKKTVLVIDEAGMVGTRQMAKLIDETEKAGTKLVLVGDARQLQPVDAGGPFGSIANRLGDVEMKEIIRQRDDWARQAVHDLADGNAENALSAFAERGLLSVSGDKPKARKALIEEWKTEGVKQPEKNLILTATNQDAVILNREAQALRRQEDLLSGEAVKTGGDSFYQGDRVVFTKNSAPRGIRNGRIGTIESMNSKDRAFEVRLDNGRSVSVPLDEYDHVKLGYAVTTHKSQGMTVENAFILTDESMQDRELSYVQGSRAKGTTRIFTTQAEAGPEQTRLSRMMNRSNQKQLALDILQVDIRLGIPSQTDSLTVSPSVSQGMDAGPSL